MNTYDLKIFIDRLVNDGEFEQSGHLLQDVLELKPEDGLASDITYSLRAYLADDHLVINFDANCLLKLPCKICNELAEHPIDCSGQIHLEPLENITRGIYDASSCIRETVLLNIPLFGECNGNCPQRPALNKFLKAADGEKEVYHPFQGL